jgi:hypothetical protein
VKRSQKEKKCEKKNEKKSEEKREKDEKRGKELPWVESFFGRLSRVLDFFGQVRDQN